VNKTTKYLVIVVVVLGLAYPGFAWLIGLRVEASMLKREQQALQQYPGSIQVISRQYHRGVYGATEELTYGFGPSALQVLAPLLGTADMAALHIIVRNTIHHGPLPQFRTVGLATFSTQVELPPQLSAKVRALLGGEPEFQVHGRLGWFGGATSVIASAGYEARLPDGTQLIWHGLTATSHTNGGLTSTSVEGQLDSLALKSSKLQVEIAGLHFSTDLKRAFDTLYTGPAALKITSVKWQPPSSSSPDQVQGLSISAAGSAQGDFYKSALQFDADAVQASGLSITNAGYDISFEHLYAPTLAAMMKDLRASAGNGTAQPAPAATLDTMKKNFIELLLHEPVVNVSRIGFRMPEGELKFSATASAPGLKREDLDGPQVQGALMEHLNVIADIRIDAALATRLMAGNARKDALAAQLDAFEKQGLIKREGAALTAHVAFGGGTITVNGKPFPPRPGP
jgi:uncharacterized protein YdgA (DUF945 family)